MNAEKVYKEELLFCDRTRIKKKTIPEADQQPNRPGEGNGDLHNKLD